MADRRRWQMFNPTVRGEAGFIGTPVSSSNESPIIHDLSMHPLQSPPRNPNVAMPPPRRFPADDGHRMAGEEAFHEMNGRRVDPFDRVRSWRQDVGESQREIPQPPGFSRAPGFSRPPAPLAPASGYPMPPYSRYPMPPPSDFPVPPSGPTIPPSWHSAPPLPDLSMPPHLSGPSMPSPPPGLAIRGDRRTGEEIFNDFNSTRRPELATGSNTTYLGPDDLSSRLNSLPSRRVRPEEIRSFTRDSPHAYSTPYGMPEQTTEGFRGHRRRVERYENTFNYSTDYMSPAAIAFREERRRRLERTERVDERLDAYEGYGDAAVNDYMSAAAQESRQERRRNLQAVIDSLNTDLMNLQSMGHDDPELEAFLAARREARRALLIIPQKAEIQPFEYTGKCRSRPE